MVRRLTAKLLLPGVSARSEIEIEQRVLAAQRPRLGRNPRTKKPRKHPVTYGRACGVLRKISFPMVARGSRPRRLGPGGHEEEMPFADPALALRFLVKTSPRWARLFDELVSERGHGHVYNAIFYYDEATPGQALLLQNPRKLWGQYWSLLEFGWR